MRWSIGIISGHDLKYRVVNVAAETEKEAWQKANAEVGENFDNQIVSSREEGF